MAEMNKFWKGTNKILPELVGEEVKVEVTL